MDTPRSDFIINTEKTLQSLVAGRLVRKTSFRRMLLGRKGIGKTTLLRSLANAATYVLHIPTIFIDYTNPRCAQLPSELIRSRFGFTCEKGFDNVDLELERTGKYVFLLIDEFVNVFGSSCEIGQDIVGELMEIGGSHLGRVHCIVSGSSSKLRQLCFGKLPEGDRGLYPNYSGLDMNSTKFSAQWIFPFIDYDEYRNVVARLYGDKDEGDILQSYFETSGNLRLMENFFDNGWADSYTTGLRQLDHEEVEFMTCLYQCVCDLQPLDENGGARYWTMFIPFATLRYEMTRRDPKYIENKSLIYNLADKGHIRYNDRHSIDGPAISLGGPRIFLELSPYANTLTCKEAAALHYPVGSLSELAETTAMKFIAMKSSVFQWGDIVTHEVRELVIVGTPKYAHQQYIGNLDMHKVVNRLWKELPDKYGADALVLRQFSEAFPNHVNAHRIQLKLGKSEIDEDTAEKIIQRFNLMRQDFEQALADSANITVVQQFLYLITTRPMRMEIKDMFSRNIVVVYDQRFLKEEVWPDNVRLLGKPYR